MRIVFMGTPDFAVPCLQKLYDLGYDVCAVFCRPDKPQGRKMILTAPPVKEKAQELGIPVYQPSTLKTDESFGILKELSPELIVVVAYGKILPQRVLDLPPFGCINIHASILPALRGAAPIQWAVINGFEETGVTSMQMNAGLDTGDILLTSKVKIGENETSEELWNRLSLLAASVLEKTLEELNAGTLTPVKQDDSLSTYAPLLSKEISAVDWNTDCAAVHNKIRGLYSWPCALTDINGKKIKLLKSIKHPGINGQPGQVLDSCGRLIIACKSGAVEIVTLQAEGKKAMNASDYLRGNPIEKNTFI
ncbi:MAG: methionyl-tRNA formyltransferase [Clostridia bacterium]|nr:methionyl-tRNA formyltransferase [Clostridia bacterium]